MSTMASKTLSAHFCFILWILNNTLKVHGSLKCCFEVLKNHSVAYKLSEPPGASCITTWSRVDVVVVDENGDVDQTVVYYESQKVILTMNEEVTYRLDCQLTGISQTVTCQNACPAEDIPRSTEGEPHLMIVLLHLVGNKIIISIVIIISFVVVIIVIVIVIVIISCKRHHCAASNSNFSAVRNAVPNDTTHTTT